MGCISGGSAETKQRCSGEKHENAQNGSKHIKVNPTSSPWCKVQLFGEENESVKFTTLENIKRVNLKDHFELDLTCTEGK